MKPLQSAVYNDGLNLFHGYEMGGRIGDSMLTEVKSSCSYSDNIDQWNAFGFQVISREEFLESTISEFLKVQRSMAGSSAATSKFDVQVNRAVGRPKRVTALSDVQLQENEVLLLSSDSEDLQVAEPKTKAEKAAWRPPNYSNWFNKHDWPLIDSALRICSFSPRETVRYLRKKYGGVKGGDQFNRLNESTVRWWLVRPGSRDFKPRFKQAIAYLLAGTNSTAAVLRPGRTSIWSEHPDLEKHFIIELQNLREAGAGLNSLVIQFRLHVFLRVHAPDLLKKGCGSFQCSRPWVRKWVQSKLNWTFRCQTSQGSKLHANWEALGRNLVLRLAYLVTAYKVPTELVVNCDQTGLQLLPVGNEKTYSFRGARKVTIAGAGDKRQISLLLGMSASGELLPGQTIFKGKTNAVVPSCSSALLLRRLGWQLTHTSNHWSSVETMQDWVDLILVPYFKTVCVNLGLDSSQQKAELLLDCFSVHRSEEFRGWMAKNHPHICMLFVPANCTSRLQPSDVGLQRSFKCTVHRQFSKATVSGMVEKLQMSVAPQDIAVETSSPILRFLTYARSTFRFQSNLTNIP
ncbi:hypothetical protein R1sor_013025 [Riccia sorocarpa]|uniref:DDE-1 domain-containing protein n=1 Tax=Riccia sorocarpa TaxID=122646 RepID=A0ABD3H7C7_9MARC